MGPWPLCSHPPPTPFLHPCLILLTPDYIRNSICEMVWQPCVWSNLVLLTDLTPSHIPTLWDCKHPFDNLVQLTHLACSNLVKLASWLTNLWQPFFFISHLVFILWVAPLGIGLQDEVSLSLIFPRCVYFVELHYSMHKHLGTKSSSVLKMESR